VKVACPGKTSTTVAKAGAEFAYAKNWQYRYEVPSTTTTEYDAITHIDTTLGRNDYCVCAFPSFAKIDDPNKPGILKTVSLTGMIHGREAMMAKNYSGYHKAAAGVDVTLPKVLELLSGTEDLNEEILNPKGLQVIKFKSGNCIVWGDRTVALDPAWKWKHQRETMSHYENILMESFDWIVFQLNSEDNWGLLKVALRSLFEPEYQKGAIRGDSFEDACGIKIDAGNNDDLSMAAGETNAELKLRLADTIERFIITVGRAGVFEQVE